MKLGMKLLAAPLLTAVVVMLSGQINAVLMTRSAQQGQMASKASLEDFKVVQSVQHQLSQVHTSVYRTVALIGSMDDPKIKAARADLTQQLGGVKKVIETMAKDQSEAQTRETVSALLQQIDKYGSQADSAIDLSSVDPNTGIAAMQGADATFAGVTKNMVAIVEKIEAKSDAALAAAEGSSSRINLILAAVGLLVAGVAVWLAWMMQRKMVAELARAAYNADQMATGNLSIDFATDRQDEVGVLMRSLGSMTKQFNQSISTVMDSSESIRLASAEIATGNQDLSVRTELTATNLQRAASSTEQITGTVKQSADAAHQASQMAIEAAEVAARGGVVVAQVVATMDDINASARKISDIIGVIDGIAFQTNILALNAAVEAARAGEQGRGFAVVASEVRSLAGRSAEAAKEIKQLIGESVTKVDSGALLVADAGKTMTEIVASVQRVANIIGEISASSSEQSSGIGEVNSAVTELDQMTQQNAALVEQSAAAAESLREQAQRLAQVVSTFELGGSSHHSMQLLAA